MGYKCFIAVVLFLIYVGLTRILSATTFESTTSPPPPPPPPPTPPFGGAKVCVLYASSGHFFRLGNGGSNVGPENLKINS